MRIPRVYVDQSLHRGATLSLDGRPGHYITQVLRLRVGQALTLFDGSGSDYHATVTHASRRECRVAVGELAATEAPGRLHVHLGIGVSRGERMDFAIQKAVELGVAAITPLFTERCVVRLTGERLQQRVLHWRGVVISACEQSGRSRVPPLATPTGLGDWLAAHPGGLVLQHRAGATLAALPPPETPLPLLIGPEGGLTDDEAGQACAAGFTAVRLGPRIMRTETAPLAALAAIQALWGDFRD
ncbi:MAG: 16S rRNA (uracil(1498)-N(3))-methyltransferase [Gammaproteobacteria bacterium]|nr:16S rRNA (uracil(1498)-N(3))-methyltransferase [Gammaproteobacteria bacterium]